MIELNLIELTNPTHTLKQINTHKIVFFCLLVGVALSVFEGGSLWNDKSWGQKMDSGCMFYQLVCEICAVNKITCARCMSVHKRIYVRSLFGRAILW